MTRNCLYIIIFLVYGFFHYPKLQAQSSRIDTALLLMNEKRLNLYPPHTRIFYYSRLADYYLALDLDKTIHYSKLIIDGWPLSNFERFRDKKIDAFTLLGMAYYEKKKYSDAIGSLLEGLELCDENFLRERYILQQRIGFWLFTNLDYELAIDYFRKAALTANHRSAKLDEGLSLMNLGSAYLVKNQLDSALHYIDLADECYVNTQTQNKLELHLMRGKIHELNGEYRKAIKLYELAIPLAKERNYSSILYKTYLRLATTYYQTGEYGKASGYFKHAENYIEDYNYGANYLDFARLGATLYALQNNRKVSGEYYAEYVQRNEDIRQQNAEFRNKSFQNLIINHQQKIAIAVLQENNKLKEINIRNSRILIMFIIAFSVICFVALVFFFINKRRRLRAKQIIKEQELTIRNQETETKLRKSELKAANSQIEGEEKERDRLAKELHDSVGGTLAGVRLELELLNKRQPSKELFEIEQVVLKSFENVRRISHNLAVPDIVMGDYEENIIRMIKDKPGKSDTIFEVNFFGIRKWNLLSEAIKLELYRIIQEASNNIIKYANAKSVEIQLIHHKEQVILSIEDDGVGFDLNKVEKGLGLRNIISRSEALNGTCDISTSPGEGVFINVNIPL